MVKGLLLILGLFYMTAYTATASAEQVSRKQIKGLDEQVQDIKKDVLDLTTELSQLEEKLLYPSNTQISLFVALKGNKKFQLDSMQIKLDNRVVSEHIYTFKELEALQAGGVQRIYTGNIKTGRHNLIITFIGRSEFDNEYKRSGKYVITKAVGPKFVEIILAGKNTSDQKIRFKDW